MKGTLFRSKFWHIGKTRNKYITINDRKKLKHFEKLWNQEYSNAHLDQYYFKIQQLIMQKKKKKKDKTKLKTMVEISKFKLLIWTQYHMHVYGKVQVETQMSYLDQHVYSNTNHTPNIWKKLTYYSCCFDDIFSKTLSFVVKIKTYQMKFTFFN